MKRYNGWANYETWNVALWLGNDEGLYRAACEWVRMREGQGIAGSDAQSFVAEVMPNGTPDTSNMGAVRWGAIASFLRELR